MADTTPAPLTGADSELPGLLDGFYACDRVWDWSDLIEDDFTAADGTDLVADLAVWRDAAVATERARLAALVDGWEHDCGEVACDHLEAANQISSLIAEATDVT